MSVNKEIRFSAKDTGVSTTMSRLRSESRRLHQDLLKDAEGATTSQKDAIKYYEEQIRMIERRNRLEQEQSKYKAKRQFETSVERDPSSARQSEDVYKQKLHKIDQGGETDKMQTQILRDLLETTKQQYRDEERSREKQSTVDRMHSQRGGGDDSDQDRRIGPSNERRDGAVMSGVKGVMYAKGLSNLLEQGEGGGRGALSTVSSGLMMSGNPAAMAAGGVMEIITGAVNLAKNQYKMVDTSARLTGRNTSAMARGGFGYGGSERIEDIGLDREEYLPRYEQSVRAYGKGKKEEDVMKDIYAERTMALDPSVTENIQRLSRTLEGVGGVQDFTNVVHNAMRGTGAMGEGEQDFSRMNDIVGTVVEMQQARFMKTGLHTGSQARLEMMRGLENMGGAFKDDQYKKATMQQLESGVATTPNKMVHAMKLREARKLAPDQNPFELMATIQSGDPRLIAPLIENMASSTQDDTLLMQRMSDMFGGQLSAQNVVEITKKVRQGKSITDAIPSGAMSSDQYGKIYREKAQQSTPAANAEALKLWNEVIKASTDMMGRFNSNLETVLNLM